MKTAQDITLNVLKGESVVIDPVTSVLEKEMALVNMGKQLGIGQGRSNKTTNAFFAEQEEEIKKVKQEFYMYVLKAGFKGVYESTIFEDFDFKIVITKKT
jgi:hypothetical protein